MLSMYFYANMQWMLIFSFTHGDLLFILQRQKRKRRTKTSDKVTEQVILGIIVLYCNMFSENLMVPFSLEVSTADITLSDIITNMMEEEEDATKAQSGRDED